MFKGETYYKKRLFECFTLDNNCNTFQNQIIYIISDENQTWTMSYGGDNVSKVINSLLSLVFFPYDVNERDHGDRS